MWSSYVLLLLIVIIHAFPCMTNLMGLSIGYSFVMSILLYMVVVVKLQSFMTADLSSQIRVVNTIMYGYMIIHPFLPLLFYYKIGNLTLRCFRDQKGLLFLYIAQIAVGFLRYVCPRFNKWVKKYDTLSCVCFLLLKFVLFYKNSADLAEYLYAFVAFVVRVFTINAIAFIARDFGWEIVKTKTERMCCFILACFVAMSGEQDTATRLSGALYVSSSLYSVTMSIVPTWNIIVNLIKK